MEKKWYCEDCGETFDEPEIVTKTTWCHSKYIGYGGYIPDTESYCPHCGSDEIDECEKCDLCGEYFPPSQLDYVGSSDFNACEECRDSLHSTVKATVMDILGEFKELGDSIRAEELLLAVLEKEVG